MLEHGTLYASAMCAACAVGCDIIFRIKTNIDGTNLSLRKKKWLWKKLLTPEICIDSGFSWFPLSFRSALSTSIPCLVIFLDVRWKEKIINSVPAATWQYQTKKGRRDGRRVRMVTERKDQGTDRKNKIYYSYHQSSFAPRCHAGRIQATNEQCCVALFVV